MMKTSHSSGQQLLVVLGKVLKGAVLGIVGAVIFSLAVTIGYQSEKQVPR